MSYAVAGEVPIDLSEIPDHPSATIDKMETVIRAALAPAAPSAQDYAVAGMATAMQQEARVKLDAKNKPPLSFPGVPPVAEVYAEM